MRRSLDLRYRSQAFELTLEFGAETLPEIERAFHRQHQAAYGHADPTAPIELVNVRLAAYGVVARPAAERYASPSASFDAALVERRRVRFEGAVHECPVWERDRLPAELALAGPAIIEEFGATTVVLPGWRGHVDGHGNLRFERA